MSRKREKLALAQLNLRQLRIRQQLEQELQAMQEKQERKEHEIRRKRELVEAEMEAERAAVSLQVYEEESVEQLQEKSFLDYLVPLSRKNEVPDNASKVSVNDQLAVHSENATIVTSALSNGTPALPRTTEQVDLIVPVSVEPTVSIPALTMSLTNPLAGNVSPVPTPMVRKPQRTPLVSSRSPLPLVDPVLPKIEPRQTSLGQRVKSICGAIRRIHN